MATKKQVSERNKLLRKVIRHIKAEPKRLNMDSWEEEDEDVPCGTTACIFGWANRLGRKMPVSVGMPGSGGFFDSVCELLSLTDDQGYTLAETGEWPLKYCKRYNSAATAKGRANATIRRIEHFIKTGE